MRLCAIACTQACVLFYLSLRYLPWVAPTLGIFANAYATASGAIGYSWMLVK